MRNIFESVISGDETVINIFQKLNTKNSKTLLIEQDNKIIGIFTEGDFRKAVLNGIDINDKVKN
jgi:CBS domain-containing protein